MSSEDQDESGRDLLKRLLRMSAIGEGFVTDADIRAAVSLAVLDDSLTSEEAKELLATMYGDEEGD